jgi:hypothetical protein
MPEPSLPTVLPCTPLGRPERLVLLRADQSLRWARGERILAETYLEAHPDLAADAAAALDLIFAEVLLRLQHGEPAAEEEYLGRFPAYAEGLRRQFALHRALAAGTLSLAPPAASLPTLADLPADLVRPVEENASIMSCRTTINWPVTISRRRRNVCCRRPAPPCTVRG